MFNEAMTLQISYFLLALNGMATKAAMFTQIGWCITYSLYVDWSVNLMVMLAIALISFKAGVKKRWLKGCYGCNKHAKKRKLMKNKLKEK